MLTCRLMYRRQEAVIPYWAVACDILCCTCVKNLMLESVQLVQLLGRVNLWLSHAKCHVRMNNFGLFCWPPCSSVYVSCLGFSIQIWSKWLMYGPILMCICSYVQDFNTFTVLCLHHQTQLDFLQVIPQIFSHAASREQKVCSRIQVVLM